MSSEKDDARELTREDSTVQAPTISERVATIVERMERDRAGIASIMAQGSGAGSIGARRVA